MFILIIHKCRCYGSCTQKRNKTYTEIRYCKNNNKQCGGARSWLAASNRDKADRMAWLRSETSGACETEENEWGGALTFTGSDPT